MPIEMNKTINTITYAAFSLWSTKLHIGFLN